MTPQLAGWNAVPRGDAEAELIACCGSERWASELAARRPFASFASLCEAADEIWWALDRADWLEAFAAHPKIGERAAAGSESSRRWSALEQAAPDAANEEVASRLAKTNRAYQLRFGFIFIVDAAGKSRAEILALLEQRLQNNPQKELREAAEQQRRIARRRLEKLFASDGGETKSA
jgi:OHCU decarboxylase